MLPEWTWDMGILLLSGPSHTSESQSHDERPHGMNSRSHDMLSQSTPVH